MLKVAMRIVPNAGQVLFREFDNINNVWDLLTVKIRPFMSREIQSSLHLKGDNKRVFVYIENDSSSDNLIYTYSKKGGSRHGINTDGCRLTEAGSVGGRYKWLMTQPEYHPDYGQTLAEHKRNELLKRQQREALEKREEELDAVISELIDQIGYDEAILRLKRE
jgi:hypothetical protein